jgi:hypothetical protein
MAAFDRYQVTCLGQVSVDLSAMPDTRLAAQLSPVAWAGDDLPTLPRLLKTKYQMDGLPAQFPLAKISSNI